MPKVVESWSSPTGSSPAGSTEAVTAPQAKVVENFGGAGGDTAGDEWEGAREAASEKE